jgi:RimJ/RimL family protein N-acetyltransferase
MKKTELLKDGTKVSVKVLTLGDLDRLMDFYQELSEKDRRYLRVDVTNREIVAQRIKQIKTGKFKRLIAIKENNVIADGTLELADEDWRKDQGELRIIVSRPFQHNGLGTIMLRELYFIAANENVKKVVVKFMRSQHAAKNICLKLGFQEQVIIPDYVRDIKGKTQDMVIMTSDMKHFWNELEHLYKDSDWQRHR